MVSKVDGSLLQNCGVTGEILLTTWSIGELSRWIQHQSYHDNVFDRTKGFPADLWFILVNNVIQEPCRIADGRAQRIPRKHHSEPHDLEQFNRTFLSWSCKLFVLWIWGRASIIPLFDRRSAFLEAFPVSHQTERQTAIALNMAMMGTVSSPVNCSTIC